MAHRVVCRRAQKFGGGASVQRALLEHGQCELLLPMGCAEVELEELDASVLPWADSVAAAFEARLAAKIAALSPAAGAAGDVVAGADGDGAEGAKKRGVATSDGAKEFGGSCAAPHARHRADTSATLGTPAGGMVMAAGVVVVLATAYLLGSSRRRR
jgi:hypothetical protein